MSASYFDCYLIPVPASRLEAYRRFSAQVAAVYREHGTTRIVDCVLDPDTADGSRFHADGAPGKIRTPNPQIRSLVLCPVELRAQPARR